MLVILALRAPVSPVQHGRVPRKGSSSAQQVRLRVAGAPRCALRYPLSRVLVLLGGRRVTGSTITTQLAPRLPAAVGSAASEVMMLGSGEFVMLLLRCCLLLMLWLLMLLLLLRPRGRTGARPKRASSPSFGGRTRSFRRCEMCCLCGPGACWSSSSIAAPSSSISGCSAPASGSTSWSVACCWWFRRCHRLHPQSCSPPKIFGAQDTRHMPERASLICIFSRRRAGRWSWVVVTGAGAGPAPLTGGGPKPVATSHSVAGGRRLGRAPSVPEATATATTTVAGGPTEDISARDISWSAPPAPRPRPPTII